MSSNWSIGWRVYKDILEGKITDKSFVVQLWYIHRGCPSGAGYVDERYGDPITFFERTYFTEGLRNILGNVLLRLARGHPSNPVILLYTGFGGGKSHTLLSIYHSSLNSSRALKSNKFREFVDELGLNPEELEFHTALSLFDGEALDPKRLREVYDYNNAWTFILGELARNAGMRDLAERIKRYSSVPPGSEEIGEILAKIESVGIRPVILIDELAMYYRKLRLSNIKEYEREASGLTMFLHSLSIAVANSKYAILAIATPQQYGEESLVIIDALQGIKRLAMPSSIVSREDAASILKAALIESIDELIRRGVAEKYFDYYEKHKEYLPGEAVLPEYRSKLSASYPFHPFLVDVLYGELTEISGFQGTRDILRLVAWALHWRVRSGDQLDFLLLGDIDATKREILDELLTRNENLKKLRDAVSYDVDILKDMDHYLAERGITRVASLTYSAILVRSTASKPSRFEEVVLGTITPIRDVAPQTVKSVIERNLLLNTAHLHEIKKNREVFYIIKSRANIYMLINKFAKDILNRRKEDVLAKIKDELSKIIHTPRETRVIIWPRHSGDIPDDKFIKLVLLDPELTPTTKSAFESELQRLIKYSQAGIGAAFRKYKNAILFLVADYNVYKQLLDKVARYLATQTLLQEDVYINYGLDERDLDDLKRIRSELRRELLADVTILYSQLYYPIDSRSDGSVKFAQTKLNIATVKEHGYWQAVKEKLQEEGKLSLDIAEDYLIEIINNLYESFYRPIEYEDLISQFLEDPSNIIIQNIDKVLKGKLKRIINEGRVLVIKDDKYACMTDVGTLEGVKLLPCSSEEAQRYCFVDKTEVYPVCKPPQPKECPQPKWDHLRKTWICEAQSSVQEEVEEIHEGFTLIEVKKKKKISFDNLNIALLVEKLRSYRDNSLRELTIEINMRTNITNEKIRALKMLTQILGRFAEEVEESVSSYYVILKMKTERSKIHIDAESMEAGQILRLIDLARSLGALEELNLKIDIKINKEVPLEKILEKLNRKMLIQYKSFMLNSVKIKI